MQLDNGTLALVVVLGALAFLVWAGRQRAPVPGEADTEAAAWRAKVEQKLIELQRGVARANTQAEEAKRIAESVAPTLEQIRWTLTQVAADVTVLRSAAAGAEAAERTLSQQRQGGGVTVNTAAPGMHFSGNATIEGPAIGGNVGTLGPPKPEGPHTV